uniref:Uncharacterized protein n=1 Tax=Anguilla anguilla TaxID=7936 RepID=A0A0E9R8V2_ANGAN
MITGLRENLPYLDRPVTRFCVNAYCCL